jgi:hypothetical protein
MPYRPGRRVSGQSLAALPSKPATVMTSTRWSLARRTQYVSERLFPGVRGQDRVLTAQLSPWEN